MSDNLLNANIPLGSSVGNRAASDSIVQFAVKFNENNKIILTELDSLAGDENQYTGLVWDQDNRSLSLKIPEGEIVLGSSNGITHKRIEEALQDSSTIGDIVRFVNDINQLRTSIIHQSYKVTIVADSELEKPGDQAYIYWFNKNSLKPHQEPSVIKPDDITDSQSGRWEILSSVPLDLNTLLLYENNPSGLENRPQPQDILQVYVAYSDANHPSGIYEWDSSRVDNGYGLIQPNSQTGAQTGRWVRLLGGFNEPLLKENNLSEYADDDSALSEVWDNLGLNSAAGEEKNSFLLVENSLSELSSNFSLVMDNLGLGTASTRNESFFLQSENLFSEIPDSYGDFGLVGPFNSTPKSDARLNLGLGTASTRNESFFLQSENLFSEIPDSYGDFGLVGPFNSTPKSDARLNLGLGTASTRNESFFLQSENLFSEIPDSYGDFGLSGPFNSTPKSDARLNLGLGNLSTYDYEDTFGKGIRGFYSKRPFGTTIYVDSNMGDDENDGFTPDRPLRTIKEAAAVSLMVKTPTTRDNGEVIIESMIKRDMLRMLIRNRTLNIEYLYDRITTNYPNSACSSHTIKSKRDLGNLYDSIVWDFAYSKVKEIFPSATTAFIHNNTFIYHSYMVSKEIKEAVMNLGYGSSSFLAFWTDIISELSTRMVDTIKSQVNDFGEITAYKENMGEELGSCPEEFSTQLNKILSVVEDTFLNTPNSNNINRLELEQETRSTIKIESGEYEEDIPIVVPDKVSIVGANLRTVVIRPKKEKQQQGSGLFIRFKDIPSNVLSTEQDTWNSSTISNDGLLQLRDLFNQSISLDLGVSNSGTVSSIELSQSPKFQLRRGDVLCLVADSGVKQYVRVKEPNQGTTISIVPQKLDNSIESINSVVWIAPRLEWLESLEGNLREGLEEVKPELTIETDSTIVGDQVFQVGSGFYFTGAVIKDHSNFAFGFRRDKPEIYASPYIQNSSSITTVGGGGCEIDGFLPASPNDNIPNVSGDKSKQISEIRSFVLDAFTQINTFGGYGHVVKNNGYAQMVSTFTTYCDVGVFLESGGLTNLSNSVTDFGIWGLISNGLAKEHYLEATNSIEVKGVSEGLPPQTEVYIKVSTDLTNNKLKLNSDNRVFNNNSKFGEFFDTLGNLDTNGLSTKEERELAKRLIQFNSSIVFSSSYTDRDGNPVTEVLSRLVSSVELAEEADSFRGNVNEDIKVVFKANQRIPNGYTLNEGAKIHFYLTSTITSSGHGFEYEGSGNDYSNALPESGGVPNPDRKTLTTGGGEIFISSTDVEGNFAVGDLFEISQATGQIKFSPVELDLKNINTFGPFVSQKIAGDIVITGLTNSSDLGDEGFPRPDIMPTALSVANYFNQNTADILTDAEKALEISFQNNFALESLLDPITDLGGWGFRHAIFHRESSTEINVGGSNFLWEDRKSNNFTLFKLPSYSDEYNNTVDIKGNSIDRDSFNLFKTRSPFTVNLVIDTSSSMASTGEFWKVKQSLISFCYNYQVEDSVVFYLFNSSTDSLQPNIFSYRNSAIFKKRSDSTSLMRNSLLRFIGTVFPSPSFTPIESSIQNAPVIDVETTPLNFVPPKRSISSNLKEDEYTINDIYSHNFLNYESYKNASISLPLSRSEIQQSKEINFILLIDDSASMRDEIQEVRLGLTQFIQTILDSGGETYFAIIRLSELLGNNQPYIYNINGTYDTTASNSFEDYFSKDESIISSVLESIETEISQVSSSIEKQVEAMKVATTLPFHSKAQVNLLMLSDEPPRDGDTTPFSEALNAMNSSGVSFLHLFIDKDGDYNSGRADDWNYWQYEIDSGLTEGTKIPGVVIDITDPNFDGITSLTKVANELSKEIDIIKNENITVSKGNYPPGYTLYNRHYKSPALLATPGIQTTSNPTPGIVVGGRTALYESVAISVNDLLDSSESKTLNNLPNLAPRNPLRDGTINVIGIMTDGEDNDSFKNQVPKYKFKANSYIGSFSGLNLTTQITDGDYLVSISLNNGDSIDLQFTANSSTVEDFYLSLISSLQSNQALVNEGWNAFIDGNNIIFQTSSLGSEPFSNELTFIEESTNLVNEIDRLFEELFVDKDTKLVNLSVDNNVIDTFFNINLDVPSGSSISFSYSSNSNDTEKTIYESLANQINSNEIVTNAGWVAFVSSSLVLKNRFSQEEVSATNLTVKEITNFITIDVNNGLIMKPIHQIYTQEILKFYRAYIYNKNSNGVNWTDIPGEYVNESLNKALDELGFIVPRFGSPSTAKASDSFPDKLLERNTKGPDEGIPNYYVFEPATDEFGLYVATMGPPVSINLEGISSHIGKNFVDLEGNDVSNNQDIQNISNSTTTTLIRLFSKMGYLSQLTESVYSSGRIGFVLLDPGFNKFELSGNNSIFARDLNNYRGLYFTKLNYGASNLKSNVNNSFSFEVEPTESIEKQKLNVFNAYNLNIQTSGVPIVKREDVHPEIIDVFPQVPFSQDNWIRETLLGINLGDIKATPYSSPDSSSDYKWNSSKYISPLTRTLFSLTGTFDSSDSFALVINSSSNPSTFTIDEFTLVDTLDTLSNHLSSYFSGWDIEEINNDSNEIKGIELINKSPSQKIIVEHYRNEVLKDKPISYWGLDQDPNLTTVFNDYQQSYPLSFQGTLNSSNSLTGFGKAISQSSTGGSFNNANSIFNKVSDFSIEMWVEKPVNVTGILVSTHDGTTSNSDWSIELESSRIVVDSKGNGVQLNGNANLLAGQTNGVYHVVFVHNLERGVELWINGELADSDHTSSGKSSITTSSSGINLFQDGNGGKILQSGAVLDEVCFYDYPLSSNQIKEHLRLATKPYNEDYKISFYPISSNSGLSKVLGISVIDRTDSLANILFQNNNGSANLSNGGSNGGRSDEEIQNLIASELSIYDSNSDGTIDSADTALEADRITGNPIGNKIYGTDDLGQQGFYFPDELKGFKDLRNSSLVYVSKEGDDSNNGRSPREPLLTVEEAANIAEEGDIILIEPGEYEENTPISIKRNVGIVGKSLRNVVIKPSTSTKFNNVLLVDSAFYAYGITFAGHQASDTLDPNNEDITNDTQSWAISFDPNVDNRSIGAVGLGAFILKSPYIQNCTSLTAEEDRGLAGSASQGDSGGGIEVDGSKCATNSPIKSMVVDSYTQVNLGGPGCLVKNDGYAQLVSFFGTFCKYHVRAESGGQVNLSGGGTSDFGDYGLMADGFSPSPIYTAKAREETFGVKRKELYTEIDLSTSIFRTPDEDHNLGTDYELVFRADEGELPSNIIKGQVYYAIPQTDSKEFKVSETKGGTPLDLEFLKSGVLMRNETTGEVDIPIVMYLHSDKVTVLDSNINNSISNGNSISLRYVVSGFDVDLGSNLTISNLSSLLTDSNGVNYYEFSIDQSGVTVSELITLFNNASVSLGNYTTIVQGALSIDLIDFSANRQGRHIAYPSTGTIGSYNNSVSINSVNGQEFIVTLDAVNEGSFRPIEHTYVGGGKVRVNGGTEYDIESAIYNDQTGETTLTANGYTPNTSDNVELENLYFICNSSSRPVAGQLMFPRLTFPRSSDQSTFTEASDSLSVNGSVLSYTTTVSSDPFGRRKHVYASGGTVTIDGSITFNVLDATYNETTGEVEITLDGSPSLTGSSSAEVDGLEFICTRVNPSGDEGDEDGNDAYIVTSSVPIDSSGNNVDRGDLNHVGYRVNFFANVNGGLRDTVALSQTIDFRNRSQITAPNHTFEYVGSGMNYDALPFNGGIPIPSRKITETSNGRVYSTNTDELGNYAVGKQFTVNGTTGAVTINTDEFNLSGLNFIGPFSRNGGLSTVGVQLREVSPNSSLIASTGTQDGNTVPTQDAVFTYLKNNYVSTNTSITAGEGLIGGGNLLNDGDISIHLEDLSSGSLTVGSYGDASNVSQIRIDKHGRVTDVSEIPIESDIEVVDTLPSIGKLDTLYLNKSDDNAYRWDSDSSQFIQVGGSSSPDPVTVNLDTTVNTSDISVSNSSGTGFTLGLADDTSGSEKAGLLSGTEKAKISNSITTHRHVFGWAISDETSDLKTGQEQQVIDVIPFDCQISDIIAGVGTAPIGSDILIDILIDDGGGYSSIFGSGINPLTIFDGNNSGDSYTLNITPKLLYKGNMIKIQVTQIGSTTAGAGLKVKLVVEE